MQIYRYLLKPSNLVGIKRARIDRDGAKAVRDRVRTRMGMKDALKTETMSS